MDNFRLWIESLKDEDPKMYNYYRSRGLDDKEIDHLMFHTDQDQWGDMPGVPDKFPDHWEFTKDPYFPLVAQTIDKTITKKDIRQLLIYLIQNADTYVMSIFKELFKPDVSFKDVQNFMNKLYSLRILNKTRDRYWNDVLAHKIQVPTEFVQLIQKAPESKIINPSAKIEKTIPMKVVPHQF